MIKTPIQRFVHITIIALTLFCVSFPYSLHAQEVKETAPQRYTVKKGDTLWGIAGMYLDESWRWPELWKNNTQIQNPHLIYPGDVLLLKFVDGRPTLMVERNKTKFVLSPEAKRKDKTRAIDILPWDVLSLYISQSWVVTEEDYTFMPRVLGNQDGAVRFADEDIVLTRQFGRPEDQYYIVRDMGTIKNMQGEELGYQVNRIASANRLEEALDNEWLVKVVDSNSEVKRADMLWSAPGYNADDLILQAADARGFVVGSLHEHAMYGKFDVVVVDIGSGDIAPGGVLGIYVQGPDIIDYEEPKYANEANIVASAFDDGTTVTQPAMKVGEMVVFSVFDKVSYGIITQAKKSVRRGFIVGHP